MTKDPKDMSIGEKIRAAEERALGHVPENKPGNKEPAEGSRDTVTDNDPNKAQREGRTPNAPRRGGQERVRG
jgi:hypothetical protein